MTTSDSMPPPRIRLVGEFEHPDFGTARELLRSSAEFTSRSVAAPELIVVAQSRPGTISGQLVQSLRRDAPSAEIVALLGTWCEGETRTGRPWPGIERLYWYEFPAWWRRRFALRAVGSTSNWKRTEGELPVCNCQNLNVTARGRGNGCLVLSTPVRETANALSDVLAAAGYSTVWCPAGRRPTNVRGAAAGVWDGGQLNEREADSLAGFCRHLARVTAPVIALLDFPRRDRCARARELGARAVLGKPWLNIDLLATIEELSIHCACCGDPKLTRAA